MSEVTASQAPKIKERLKSVDILRGFTMFLLLASGEIGGAGITSAFLKLINTPPGVSKYFVGYGVWEGLSLHLLIAPMFIFVSGITVPFSTNKRLLLSQQNKGAVYLHIIKRFVVFYLLGLFVGAHLNEFRHELAYIPLYNNILQQIGISYLVCAILILNKVPVKVLVALTAALLLLYWMIFLFIPSPDGDGDPYSRMNIATYVDKIVLGTHGGAWKKGGWGFLVLGTINFISNMLLGVLMGYLLMSNRNKKEKTKLLFLYGSGMVLAGLIWSPIFPIIRHIYSSSYVLLTCGISTLILALLYLVIDVRGHSKWAFFFLVFGVNSIAVYVAAHIYNFRLISNTFVGGFKKFLNPDLQNFIEASAAMAVIWFILYLMYRTKTFLKV